LGTKYETLDLKFLCKESRSGRKGRFTLFFQKMWPFIWNYKPKLDRGVWVSDGYYYGICVIQNKTNLVDAYDLNNVDPILTSTLFKN
jgi:hypothetical protein